MKMEMLLALARTFSGAQLAAIARVQDRHELGIVGARFRDERLSPAGGTVMTYDVLVRLGDHTRASTAQLLVLPTGYTLDY